jgi:hypothetical protein
MKTAQITGVTIAAVLVGVWLAVYADVEPAAAAQQARSAAPAAAASGSIPRTPWDGKPNLTGVWAPSRLGAGPTHDPRTPTPEERNDSQQALMRLYQPWALERSLATASLDDPRLHCGPYGFPKYINIPDYFLMQIVHAPKEILVFVEYVYSGFRIIPTDGSPRPKNIIPSFLGSSSGLWEGDALVVDVTGFNGKIWLPGTPPGGRGGGWITSDALHEVERWRLLDADTLEYQATVEDPKVLTGPWTTPKFLLKRAPEGIIPHEALCLEPEGLEHMKAIAK